MTASHRPAPVDIARESVAGEEDPGAAADLADVPAAPPDAPPSPADDGGNNGSDGGDGGGAK